MNKQSIDFLAIGDVFIDTFIQLESADIHTDENGRSTLTLPWADKIPYQEAIAIPGVGNAGNAAVAAARLGTTSSLLTIFGTDADGERIEQHYRKENLDQSFITRVDNLPTNNAYVLQYGPERTILVNQQPYQYQVPMELLADKKPKWIYFTSITRSAVQFHHDLAAWVTANPGTQLAFQPGTFQMQLGKEELADIYAASTAFFCNKEEAQRILGIDSNDYAILHATMRNLGPKIVVITDGVNGLTYSDETGTGYHLPMYPDPKPPVSRTGAGDATSSTIIAALSIGIPLEQAVLWGPINSMNVVQAVGAQTNLATKEKILELLKDAPADYKLTKIF